MLITKFVLAKVLTKDSVTVSVDAVVYYRVSNATVSVANVENAHHSTRWVRVDILARNSNISQDAASYIFYPMKLLASRDKNKQFHKNYEQFRILDNPLISEFP